MKVVKHVSLEYQETGTHRVYEVDLCEAGEARFVVNFRYGRRGAILKEGTKTVDPIPLKNADKIFNELVADKKKKGYREAAARTQHERPVPDAQSMGSSQEEAQRELAVLERLRAGTRPPGWPLDRPIWRAGELKLRAASPLLISLIGTGGALRDYCIAWSLGRCGDQAAVPALARMRANHSASDAVRRIAREALRSLGDESFRLEFQAQMLERLPKEMRDLATNGPPAAFETALGAWLDQGGADRLATLEVVYLIDNANVRPALLGVLGTAPLRPNYFQRIRHIFKASEYRRDAEVFGLIAYRFETSRAMFNNDHVSLSQKRGYSYVSTPDLDIADGRAEIKGTSPAIAYGSRTRAYLRRRVCRTLRWLGELGDADYVKMALGVLLVYSDADADTPQETFGLNWTSSQSIPVCWDAYACYPAFNYILYANSPRYVLRPGSVTWRCRPGYQPGQPGPSTREEAFPHLWDQAPASLLRLILESECQPVLEFAVKAITDCKQYCAALSLDDLIKILGRPYDLTARFGLALAKERCHGDDADPRLVLAVANCMLEEGRVQARLWIESDRQRYAADLNFMVGLITSAHGDTRGFARELARTSLIDESAAKVLVARIIACLLALDQAQGEYAADVAETVLKCFARVLRDIGMKVVLDLLAHPLREVQELGGNILLNHETQARDLPQDVIQSLIASPFEQIRSIGMNLFGQLPDEILLGHVNLLASLSMHELADIRNATRPVIRGLCEGHPGSELEERLSAIFIATLGKRQKHEGVHQHLAGLLVDDLSRTWMPEATPGTFWKMLQAKSVFAQNVGAALLKFKLGEDPAWADQFETAEIVELSNHEIRAVREASWTTFTRRLDRFKAAANPAGYPAEMAQAARLLDAKWDDSRAFWFKIFRESFGAKDFTPAILVNICDSVREDVREFGRVLISRFFTDADGQEYLLKLSEHPSSDLQQFAAGYLERYAADSPQRLEELTPYFTSVLSRVNKARIAKSRVLKFLSTEALKSEPAARIVAGILARQSATIAIGDKAATIEAMVKIHRAYPEIPLPIQVRAQEVRRAV
ncbi:MAG TPA: WGR domain-containing protein [Blastocatellia bacterium]|nr:WGR domain-containing protein [Blastocatellia bacterium]